MIDLLKFNKPEQFPKDEILNERDRLVRSWMSVEVTDKQGDIVPVDQLKKVLNTWFKRGATMMDQHTNRPIGRGLRWQESTHEKTGKPGIILDYQIFDDYSIDHQIWDDIKEGKRTGLSIGGRATEKPAMKEDDYTGSMGKYLQGLELYEVSPVDSPANQFGTNIAVNYLAKSMKDMSPQEMRDQLLKDLTKGIAGEIQKPFAGFENFDACVTAQQEKGHSEDSAKRICGFIMHQTEKKFMENKSEEIKKPFGEYKDFEDCVRANQDKDSPEAYCASVEHQITGKWPGEKSEYGPGGHKRDKTGPHGSGAGPGEGTAECRDDVDKGRVYLSPGQKPPEGASIRQGPHGGRYYEEKPGAKPGQKPGAPKKPEGKKPEKISEKQFEYVDWEAKELISQGKSVKETINTLRNDKKVTMSDEKLSEIVNENYDSKPQKKPGQSKITAQQLMDFDEKIWDENNWRSAEGPKKNWEKYKQSIKSEMDKKGIKKIPKVVWEKAEDENYHSILEALNELGYLEKSLNKRWPIEFVKAISQLQKSAEPWPAEFIKACDKPKSLNS